ncbi:MAG: sulfotransferase domain-containing protein [Planctomycetota bacterium]
MTAPVDFLVIGAMKCATSSLAEQLNGQPGIFVTDPKEPCFFSDDPVYARGLDWYRDLFSAAAVGDLRGEASTHYTKLPTYPDTVARIQEHAPDVRLVYVMRHPVDRLVSHYIHAWTMNEVRAPIDDAVDGDLGLVDYGRYAMQLQPFLAAFGRARVLPVFYDRLTAAPDDELRRVCAFLGYRGEPRWREDAGRQNVSADRMRQNPLRDALVYAPGISQVRKLLPQGLRDRVKRMWQMRKRPELSPARRRALEAVFDRDLAELGDLLGVPLTCANFKQQAAARAYEWRDA